MPCKMHNCNSAITIKNWTSFTGEVYLLVLIKIDVFFILLKKVLSQRPWVSGVKEQDTTTKSLSLNRVSNGTEKEIEVKMRGHDIIFISLINNLNSYIEWHKAISFPTIFPINLLGLRFGLSACVQQSLNTKRLQSPCNGQTYKSQKVCQTQ